MAFNIQQFANSLQFPQQTLGQTVIAALDPSDPSNKSIINKIQQAQTQFEQTFFKNQAPTNTSTAPKPVQLTSKQQKQLSTNLQNSLNSINKQITSVQGGGGPSVAPGPAGGPVAVTPQGFNPFGSPLAGSSAEFAGGAVGGGQPSIIAGPARGPGGGGGASTSIFSGTQPTVVSSPQAGGQLLQPGPGGGPVAVTPQGFNPFAGPAGGSSELAGGGPSVSPGPGVGPAGPGGTPQLLNLQGSNAEAGFGGGAQPSIIAGPARGPGVAPTGVAGGAQPSVVSGGPAFQAGPAVGPGGGQLLQPGPGGGAPGPGGTPQLLGQQGSSSELALGGGQFFQPGPGGGAPGPQGSERTLGLQGSNAEAAIGGGNQPAGPGGGPPNVTPPGFNPVQGINQQFGALAETPGSPGGKKFEPLVLPNQLTPAIEKELGLTGEQKAFQIFKRFAELNQKKLTAPQLRALIQKDINAAGITEEQFRIVKRALGSGGGDPALEAEQLRRNVAALERRFGPTAGQIERANNARKQASGFKQQQQKKRNQAIAKQQAQTNRFQQIQRKLENLQLNNLQNLGTPTEEELQFIESARANAQAAGESAIEGFFNRSLRKIREELGPSLGLRRGDTPLIDRGGFIAEEALRQQGALTSGLAAQASQQALQVPLARAGITSQGTLGSLGLLFQGRGQQFNQALAARQQAFAEEESLQSRLIKLRQLSLQNMIALQSLFTGGSAQLAGLSSGSVPFPQLDLGGITIGNQSSSSQVGSNQLAGQAAGALGGALSGLSIGAASGNPFVAAGGAVVGAGVGALTA